MRKTALFVCLSSIFIAATVQRAVFAGPPPSVLGSRAAVQQPQPVAPPQATVPPQSVVVPAPTPPSTPQPVAQRAIQTAPVVPATTTPNAGSSAPSTPAAMQTPGTVVAKPARRDPMRAAPAEKPVSIQSPRRNDLMRAEAAMLADLNSAAQSAHAAGATQRSARLANPNALTQASSQFSASPGLGDVKHVSNKTYTAPDGIHYVNNKQKDFVITPGGYLTITGQKFGAAGGQAAFVPDRTGGRYALQVLEWADDQLYALVPATIAGVPDQPATLQIVTQGGRTFSLDAAQFHAARGEQSVSQNLDRYLRVESSPSWSSGLNSWGEVRRDMGGESIDCPKPGTDRVVVLPLPQGYQVTGISMVHERTDSGDGDTNGEPGSRVFFPGYSFGAWQDETVAADRLRSTMQSSIPVNWGVFRSHRSSQFHAANVAKVGPLPVPLPAGYTTPQSDWCLSGYTLTLTLWGPAGVPAH